MTGPVATRLQLAADMIRCELGRRGEYISPADALHLARRLHQVWTDRVEPRTLKPGEIAQRFRDRYNGEPPKQQGD